VPHPASEKPGSGRLGARREPWRAGDRHLGGEGISAVLAFVVPTPVVVEIAPPNAPLPLRQALLQACSRAVRDSSCLEAEGSNEEPVIVAIVSWRSGTHVRVDVALRPEREWVVREMDFEATDAPEERWRTVGLAIGTLASAIVEPSKPATAAPNTAPPPNQKTEPAAPASAAPAPPPAAPAPPPIEARPDVPAETTETSRRHLEPFDGFVAAGLVLGPALNGTFPRAGGEVEGRLRVAPRLLYAALGASFAQSTAKFDGVRLSFFETWLGLALVENFGRVTGALYGDGLVRLFAPELGSGGPGPRTGSRWLGGARVGVDATFWATRSLGAFVGAGGDWVAGATDLAVGDRFVGSAGPFGYTLRAGVAMGFR
jgi:hypothetical protein